MCETNQPQPNINIANFPKPNSFGVTKTNFNTNDGLININRSSSPCHRSTSAPWPRCSSLFQPHKARTSQQKRTRSSPAPNPGCQIGSVAVLNILSTPIRCLAHRRCALPALACHNIRAHLSPQPAHCTHILHDTRIEGKVLKLLGKASPRSGLVIGGIRLCYSPPLPPCISPPAHRWQ